MSILIGIPTVGNINPVVLTGFFNTFLNFRKYYPDTRIDFSFVEREIIHTAREQILIKAYREHYDYLFFIDDDMVLARTTMLRLFGVQLPAVSAFYCGRQKPYIPVLYELNSEHKYKMVKPDFTKTFNRVGGTGLACALVNRKVIEATAYKSLWDSKYSHGEDVRFWELVKEAGFDCLVDVKNQVGHFTSTPLTITYENHIKFIKDIKCTSQRTTHTNT